MGDCPICSAKGVEVFPPALVCNACIDRAFSLPLPFQQQAMRGVRFGPWEAVRDAFAAQEESRLAWLPINLRDTVAEKLPNPESATAALAWKPTTTLPFLLVRGVTGRGKTRLLAMLLLAEFKRTGREPFVFWAGDLGAELASAWRNGDAEKFIDRAKSAAFLAFDDLDKVKVTERVAEFLFAVTDHRMRHGLPMVITTNLNGDAFERIMPAEYGPAILRRWRESGKLIAP